MILPNSEEVNHDLQLCSTNKLTQELTAGDKATSVVNSDIYKNFPPDQWSLTGDGKEVSKQEPYLCCGKTGWCFRLKDGNAFVCGRTNVAPQGWKWLSTASDGRGIFAKEDNLSYTQHSQRSYTPNKKCVFSPPLNTIRLTPQTREDFPVWTDLGQPVDEAIERQITYSYADPTTGKPLGRIVRCQWSDRRPVYKGERSKEIRPEYWADSPNPKEGKWLLGKGKQLWPLYREAEVREAIAHDKTVIFYGGGEQAVESFRKLGLTAFCNQGGEGTCIKQIEDFLRSFQPKLFVVWADHDQQGAATKAKLLRASETAGVPVVAIDPLEIWTAMPPKGDITNVLEESGMELPEIIRRLEAEIHRALSQRQQGITVLEQERQKLPATAAIAAELATQYRRHLAFDSRTSRFLRYEAELPGVWSGLPDIEVQAMVQAELDA